MAGLALLLGIDPFMQRGRGLTNYIGNGVAAIAIAASEKEVNLVELNARLAAGPDVDPDGAAQASPVVGHAVRGAPVE
jgi:aerobic C4-dicarboxylate transport protein